LMDQGTDVVDILAGRVIPLRLGLSLMDGSFNLISYKVMFLLSIVAKEILKVEKRLLLL
jgi:hypothetical protein